MKKRNWQDPDSPVRAPSELRQFLLQVLRASPILRFFVPAPRVAPQCVLPEGSDAAAVPPCREAAAGPDGQADERWAEAAAGLDPATATEPEAGRAVLPAPYARQFDGSTPAPGTTDTRAWRPVAPAITSSFYDRHPDRYADVIDQFAVAANPRYQPRDSSGDGRTNTFCNIFVWDVTRAMDAPIPHWLRRGSNEPLADAEVLAAPDYGRVAARAYELDASSTARWLAMHGAGYGWHPATAQAAQANANEGRPAVAVWASRSAEPGHMAVVRPGEFDSAAGPVIAQAGEQNWRRAHVRTGFGTERLPEVVYFVHA